MTTTTPMHLGEHLAEFHNELGIIAADSELRNGRALGAAPEFWLNLQRQYDLGTAGNDPVASAC